MKFVLYTNSVSAHQLPFAREIVRRVGVDNFRYIYTGGNLQGGNQEVKVSESWILQEKVGGESRSTAEWLENCDVLLVGGLRPIDLLERRSAKGLRTFYQSERWFKPIPLTLHLLHFCTAHILLPGWLRMLHPRYRKMAKRFVRLMNDDPNFITLPIGPWAKKDFLRLGVRADKMIDWGYFVEEGKSRCEKVKSADDSIFKVLYIGRLLKLKHVDTIIRAIAHLNSLPSTLNPQPATYSTSLHLYTANNSHPTPTPLTYTLTIVGDGPEKPYLQKLATSLTANHQPLTTNSTVDLLSRPTFSFQPSVPIREVRAIMRSHDVLVFASDATDGWGAVVSEALSEGVSVIGTYETGASAAFLPDAQLFHCGDWRTLARKLTAPAFERNTLPLEYTVVGAADRLMTEVNKDNCQ